MADPAARYCRLWKLTPEGILGAGLSSCLAVRDARGAPAILKLPQHPEWGRQERRALGLWSGHGVPKILAADDLTGVLLIERILPGSPPSTAADRSPERLGAALARLATDRPPDNGFPTLAERIRERVKWRVDYVSSRELRPALGDLDAAAIGADRLCASAGETILIHGDFQEKNCILGADGEMVVIDPLPCLGERAFDVALAALTSRSGLPRPDFVERMSARVACDAGRVFAWAALLPAIIGAEHVTSDMGDPP
jgi:streptomycin 6-kinase